MACEHATVEGAVPRLLFDAACVEALAADPAVLAAGRCPADEVAFFIDSFMSELKLHVQIFNMVVLFVVLTATQLGGVPRPTGGVQRGAFALWLLMTLVQWTSAVLSFTSVVLSYRAVQSALGQCLVPLRPSAAGAGAPTLLDVLFYSTLAFQPALTSKLLVLTMYPLAISSGYRGVLRFAEGEGGPALKAAATAVYWLAAGCMGTVIGTAALAYAATLLAWFVTATFAFAPVFLPLALPGALTAAALVGGLNGLTRVSARASGKLGAAVIRDRDRRESMVSMGSIAPVPTATEPRGRAGGTLASVAIERARAAEAAEAASAPLPVPKSAKALAAVAAAASAAHGAATFYLYWCDWAELRRVERLLQLRAKAAVVLRACGIVLLAALHLALLPLAAALSASAACRDVVWRAAKSRGRSCLPRAKRGGSVRELNAKFVRAYVALSPLPAPRAEPAPLESERGGASSARSAPAASPRTPSSPGGGGGGGFARARLMARAAAVSGGAADASSPGRIAGRDGARTAVDAQGRSVPVSDYYAVVNHPFSTAFLVFALVSAAAPMVIASAWAGAYYYGHLPPTAASTAFVAELYAFAGAEFRSLRIPALDGATLLEALDVRRALAALSQGESAGVRALVLSSRGLAAVSVLLSATKPIAFFLMGLLFLYGSVGARKLDIVELGITARMASAVPPSHFGRPLCDLGGRILSDVEFAALCATQLHGNGRIATLSLHGTELSDADVGALCAVLPSMRALRCLLMGAQPRLSGTGGGAALGKAVGAISRIELFEIDGVEFPLGEPAWRGTAAAAAAGGGGKAGGGGSGGAAGAGAGGGAASFGGGGGGGAAGGAKHARPARRVGAGVAASFSGTARERAPPAAELHARARPGAGEGAVYALIELVRAGRAPLRTLRLGGAAVGEEAAAALAPTLEELHGLAALGVSGAKLPSVGALGLVQAALHRRAGGASRFELLDLSQNSALGGADGGASLTRALGAGRSLRSLNLAGTGLKPDAMLALPPLPALRELDLRDNELGTRGAEALARSLSFGALPQLSRLLLARNNIGAHGMVRLGGALPSVHRTLTELELGGNEIRAEGAKALASALPRLRALRRLGLGSDALDDDAAASLAAGLRSLRLEAIELQGLGGAADGAAALFGAGRRRGREQLGALLRVDLAPNSLGPEGARALATAFARSGAVQRARLRTVWLPVATALGSTAELDLRASGRFGLLDAVVLAELVATNTGLRRVIFGPANALSLDARDAVRTAWAQSSSRHGVRRRAADLVFEGDAADAAAAVMEPVAPDTDSDDEDEAARLEAAAARRHSAPV